MIPAGRRAFLVQSTRLACACLASLGLASKAALGQYAPDYAGVDHVALHVADIGRSLDFYARLFGPDIWREQGGERRHLVLGNAHLALEQQAPARVEYVGIGVEALDPGAMHAFLEHQGIPWHDEADGSVGVADRDGNRTRLTRADGWTALQQAALAEPRAGAGAPLFRPLAIDEIFLTVANLEVDSLFYARLLDRTGTLQAGSLWFDLGGGARLRLTQAPQGQAPGLNYFAVLVSNTDMEAAAEAVFAAGGIIETLLPNGFSFWDPDGHRVLVRTAGMF